MSRTGLSSCNALNHISERVRKIQCEINAKNYELPSLSTFKKTELQMEIDRLEKDKDRLITQMDEILTLENIGARMDTLTNEE